MKLFKFPILAILAVATMLTACSDDGYWDGYEANGDEYSISQSAVNLNCTPGAVDSVITIQVMRSNAIGNVTIPLEVDYSAEGVFSFPTEVTFANGSKTADVNIAVNPDLVPGKYIGTVELNDSISPVSVSGNAECVITINVQYNWVSLGIGEFYDGFTLGNQYFNVEIMKAEGAERYRVMNPYKEGMNADTGEWEDWRNGKSTPYIEFWTEEDGVSIDFEPFAIGVNYEGVAGQDIVAYPYYYFASTAGNGAYTSWYQKGYACLAPMYYIDGLGGFNYTTNFGCIQIILPGVE